jgi:hypothetical protein
MSPVRTEFPVLVMVVPAITASGAADPRSIAAAPNAELVVRPKHVIAPTKPMATTVAARRA